MYTRSFLERTRYMIEKEKGTRTKEYSNEININSENREEIITQLFKSAEELISQKKYHHALSAVGKVLHIDQRNYYAQAFLDRIEALMQTEAANKTKVAQNYSAIQSKSDAPTPAKPIEFVQDKFQIQSKKIPLPQSVPNNQPLEEVGRFALYRELLKECWADGVITPEESDMLHRMRSQYSISFDTHCQIELDIKINAYLEALRIVWLDGVVNENEQKVLEVMRKKFGITPEEQAVAEERFFLLHKTSQPKAMMLVVDNDQNNSIYVARALISQGYDAKIEQHPDNALSFLSTHTPDLIISEVVFPQLDTDGFEFFQRTRSDERLSQIPFLMMTNPGDARIVRAGLRMGVDYFIPKPVNIEFMMAVVEGKLKSGLQSTI